MIRHSDWRMRLTGYVAQAATQGFVPGQQDCALFAAGGIAAMTGTDLAAPYRDTYHSLKGGLAALQRAGHADHVALLASLLPEVPVAYGQVGDVAVLDGPDGLPALGLVQGDMIYVLLPATGLGLVPLTDARRMFRV